MINDQYLKPPDQLVQSRAMLVVLRGSLLPEESDDQANMYVLVKTQKILHVVGHVPYDHSCLL